MENPSLRPLWPTRDRKSTRLNSSHANISYAVFCFKKQIADHTQRSPLYRGYDPGAHERLPPRLLLVWHGTSLAAPLVTVPCFRTILYFFFNDTATTEIYTLSLHDALPICSLASRCGTWLCVRRRRCSV